MEIPGYIRIIKVPHGEKIPKHIRAEWLGVQLPCIGYDPGRAGLAVDMVTGEKEPKELIGENPFVVPQKEAIEALERISKGAAKWWRESGYLEEGGHFIFSRDEAEEVVPGSIKSLHEEPDELIM